MNSDGQAASSRHPAREPVRQASLAGIIERASRMCSFVTQSDPVPTTVHTLRSGGAID
jgi:hypothetical protein